MVIQNVIDLISAIFILSAAIVPAYLSIKLKGDTRKITIALAAFVFVHGIYHLVRMQGMESMADSILEPVSIMILITFGITYLDISRKKKRSEVGGEDEEKGDGI